jgi:AraC family L-rhamnose operon transcriptional activator RhaR/AraC family L-rhamnose operon regulatory protein RhaS
MRFYYSEKFFHTPDFPLHVAKAKQQEFMADHGHDFIELVLVSSGKSLHRMVVPESENASYGIIRGEVFAVMPGEVHSYCDSKNFEICNIAFLPQVIANELAELNELSGFRALFERKSGEPHRHLYLDIAHRELAEKYLQAVIYAESRRAPAWKLQAKTAFLNFLFIIGEAEVQVREPVKVTVQSRFLDSLDYLEKNIKNKLTLEKLARIASMSVSGYTAQFRKTVGLSPMEYLINLRINQARQLLIHSDMELAEIAAACGFCDTNYMIKLFRLREKITPGKLRRSQRH